MTGERGDQGRTNDKFKYIAIKITLTNPGCQENYNESIKHTNFWQIEISPY